MLPEWKYNQISRMHFLFSKILVKIRIKKKLINLSDNRIDSVLQLLRATDDIIEFFNINRREFYENIDMWEKTEKLLWEKSVTLKEFYESWNSKASLQNACVNTINQLIWFENYNVCSYFAEKSNVIVDYGCGTGALSTALALNGKIKNQLIQLDVPNDINNFRKFRIQKYNFKNIITENIFTFNKKSIADLVICFDVLEHIEESSEVFINSISTIIKTGGFLILRAPWRGQMTHIDKAADDFYLNGGRKFLSSNYKEVYRFGSLDICAVYQKIK